VNPLSRGVTATPKKTAILEAVRGAQGLKNGYKSITVPGHPRQLIAQKELVSSNPPEGGIAQTRRAIIAAAYKQRTEWALEGKVVDEA
jgi:hypothetical protein